MKPNGTEAGTMAKAQKTVMIPEELYRIFADQEKRTGITFSRQALAAFCAYFFTERTGPDPVWVEAIVAYENGTLSIADLPAYVAIAKAERARKVATEARRLLTNDSWSPFDPNELERDAGRMQNESFLWTREAERAGNPIANFMDAFKHYQAQLNSHLHPQPPLSPESQEP